MDNRPKSNAIPINGSKNGNQSILQEAKQASPVLQTAYQNSVSNVKFSDAPPENIIPNFPKKKGGFVITGVKDDGDESADDLDVSHASYSDISYSRTTDVDHDQESTASEDTINIVLQSENPPPLSQPQGQMGEPTKAQQHSSTLMDQNKSAIAGNGNVPNKINPQVTKPQGMKESVSEVGTRPTPTTASLSVTTAKSTASTAPAPAKQPALRTYKFVKRDTHNPVNRAKFRWGCVDYLDLHSPCYANVTHSASTLKIGHNDNVQQGNMNSSAPNPSIVASSSSYTLPHSDSNSSIQRDVATHSIPTSANPTTNPTQIQQSASSSSVKYDLDPLKTQMGGPQKVENNPAEYTGWETESLKNMATTTPPLNTWQNNLELAHEGKDEKEAQRTVRIDNRIEQAMDLVKRHLTLAVRYEIAELCDRVSELQEENWKLKVEVEVMRSMIPSELLLLYPHKLKEYVASNSLKLKKSATSQQHQPTNQQAQGQNVYLSKPTNVAPPGYSFPMTANQQQQHSQQLPKNQHHQQPPTPSTIQGPGQGGITTVTGAGLPQSQMQPNANQQAKVLMSSSVGRQPGMQQMQQQQAPQQSGTSQQQQQHQHLVQQQQMQQVTAQQHAQMHHQQMQLQQQKQQQQQQQQTTHHQTKQQQTHHQYQPQQQQYQQQIQYQQPQQQKPPQMQPTQSGQIQQTYQQQQPPHKQQYQQQPQYQPMQPGQQYQQPMSAQQQYQQQQQMQANHYQQQHAPRHAAHQQQQKMHQQQPPPQQQQSVAQMQGNPLVNSMHNLRQTPSIQTNNMQQQQQQPMISHSSSFYSSSSTNAMPSTMSGLEQAQQLKQAQPPSQQQQINNMYRDANSMHMTSQSAAQHLVNQQQQQVPYSSVGGLQNTASGSIPPPSAGVKVDQNHAPNT